MNAANQLTPIEVVRDDYGQWTHPVYLKYLDEHFGDDEFITKEQWEEMKRYFNIQTITLWLSSSVSEDDFEEIMEMETADLSKWNPSNPSGFFLIDIGYTEDDAHAFFAREICTESEVK